MFKKKLLTQIKTNLILFLSNGLVENGNSLILDFSASWSTPAGMWAGTG